MQIVVAQHDLYAAFMLPAKLQTRQRLRATIDNVAHQPKRVGAVIKFNFFQVIVLIRCSSLANRQLHNVPWVFLLSDQYRFLKCETGGRYALLSIACLGKTLYAA